MLVNRLSFFSLLAIIILGCTNANQGKEDPREKDRIIDSASLSYLRQIDRKSGNAVFVLTKDYPETRTFKNKTIILPPLNQDLSINYDEYVRKEYMGPIYILLPSYYTGVRASVILKCFPAYKGFTLKDLSDNYVIYSTNQKR